MPLGYSSGGIHSGAPSRKTHPEKDLASQDAVEGIGHLLKFAQRASCSTPAYFVIEPGTYSALRITNTQLTETSDNDLHQFHPHLFLCSAPALHALRPGAADKLISMSAIYTAPRSLPSCERGMYTCVNYSSYVLHACCRWLCAVPFPRRA